MTAPNAVVRQEMPFADTIPYVKHASIGIAPYANEGAPGHLSDTSLKLAQYEFVGLNAVCPFFACGEKPGRFGYDPGDASSIFKALTEASFQAKISTGRLRISGLGKRHESLSGPGTISRYKSVSSLSP